MGEDFNLTNWCSTWLKSSGINILEPIVELNEDGSLKSLKIKQSLGLRGQNRLRKQKLNVALYKKSFAKGDSPLVIENVVISETEELTNINISELPPDFVIGAINVNHDEHAYCKVRFDKKSVNWFTDNLHLV
jgi:aminopeptidase N